MNRTVLCADPEGAGKTLYPALAAAGWDADVVASPAQVRQGARSGRYRVGLLVLGNHSGETWLGDVERVCEGGAGIREMEWVALVAPQLMGSTALREQIYACCRDYHTLPADTERLTQSLGHAHGIALLGESLPAQAGAASRDIDASGLIGESEVMGALRRRMGKVVAARVPVLITGESGTGKERVALALHAASARRNYPFVAVNCAALAPTLVQSELFGHERGAFTGATGRKIGRIEAASGGTLLLDEVGDLPPEVQVGLLRFLQEGTIERVGSTESIKVDLHIIAATHVDLDEAVRRDTFRPDLYYRLDALQLHVPALRERGEDVVLLARHFFEQMREETRCSAAGFSTGALEAMRQYAWPGNVRELMNRVRQAMVMCERRLIAREDLGLERRDAPRVVTSLVDARCEAERRVILACRDRHGGNVTRMANALEVSRQYLYELMAKHEIEPKG